MSSFSKSEYRPDIDGLRAFAILFVLAFHAFPDSFKSGFIGVDIFFVISGYLISKIILENLAKGTFSFIKFYSRRIQRIFPALITVLLTSYLLSWVAFYPEERLRLTKHLFSGAFFVSNFLFISESGYFDTAAITKPLLHLWSLSVEEQFYLIWPLIIVFLWTRKISYVLVVSLLILISLLYNLVKVYPEPTLAFYSPLSRFWELLFGSLLAWLVLKREKAESILKGNLLAASGALLILFALLVLDRNSLFPGGWAILPVAGTALIIAAGPQTYINKFILASPVLVWVGLISYPLYLWHWLLISFAEITSEYEATYLLKSIAIGISFFLAWLTYKFVELPVRRGIFQKPIIAYLVVANFSIGIIGAITYISLDNAREMIKNKVPTVAVSHSSVRQREGKIVLIGDSHAQHLHYGLKMSYGDKVIDRSHGGCLPLKNIDMFNKLYPSGRCTRFTGSSLAFLENDKSVDRVVISSMGPVYLTGEAYRVKVNTRVDGLNLIYIPNKGLTDRWRIYELALRDTLTEISSFNKKIVFVLDIPEIGSSPTGCKSGKAIHFFDYSVSVRQSTLQNCIVKRADFESRIGLYREVVKGVLRDFPQVIFFDPTALFCDSQYCHWSHGGNLLYKDADHLTNYGSEYLASGLVPVIDNL